MKGLTVPAALSAAFLSACLGLQAAEVDSLRTARYLRNGDTSLTSMAANWKNSVTELAKLVRHDDSDIRMGAARILPLVNANSEDVFKHLLNSGDPACIRVGCASLGTRIHSVPIRSLFLIPDTNLIATLIADHPEAVGLPDGLVRNTVRQWLPDPASCRLAAGLIVQHGKLADWDKDLLALLKSDNQTLQRCAHNALCLLTRTQRSLSAYAGYVDLLVDDWRDTIAKYKRTHQEADADLLAIIANLPDKDATLDLLKHGSTAVFALETAMGGVDRARRKELATIARLCARDVSPMIYTEMGADALEGMDAEALDTRMQCLRQAAELVEKHKEPAGILHILSYADDKEASIRSATYDLLVRLSDYERDFGQNWKIDDKELFSEQATVHRLRHSLSEGGVDERLSCLQLIATLEATQLSDDVMAQTLHPDGQVVDAALDCLRHLNISKQIEPLLAILKDNDQPAVRRMTIAKMVGSSTDRLGSSDADKKQRAQILTHLKQAEKDVTDPTTRKALTRAIYQAMSRDELGRISMIEQLLTKETADKLLAMELISSKPMWYRSSKNPHPISLALPYLLDANQELAQAALHALDGCVSSYSSRAADIKSLLTDAMLQLLTAEMDTGKEADYQRLAICTRLGLLSPAQSTQLLDSIKDPKQQVALWLVRLAAMDDIQAALTIIIERQDRIEWDTDYRMRNILNNCVQKMVRHPDFLNEMVTANSVALLNPRNTDRSYGDKNRTMTFTFEDKQKLVLVGTRIREQRNSSYSYSGYLDKHFKWSVKTAPANHPNDAELAQTIALLKQVKTSKNSKFHKLILALLTKDPVPEDCIDTYDRHKNIWKLILRREPSWRGKIIAWFAKRKSFSFYYMRDLIEAGNPDILPAIYKALAIDLIDDRWDRDRILDYALSLQAEQLTGLLPKLIDDAGFHTRPKLHELLGKQKALSLDLFLQMLAQHMDSQLPIVHDGKSDATAAIGKTLRALDRRSILSSAAMLRRLRHAQTTAFDAALQQELDQSASDERRLATWLRTAIPLAAGHRALYEQALQAKQDDLWLAGAALAVKESKLDAAGLLQQLTTRPARVQADAGIVARRYLTSEQLAAHGKLLAPLLRSSASAGLLHWILISPPTAEVQAALETRATDVTASSAIHSALLRQLRQDPAAWQQVVDAVVAASQGRLSISL